MLRAPVVNSGSVSTGRTCEANARAAGAQDDPDDEFGEEEAFLNLDDVLEGAHKWHHACALYPSARSHALRLYIACQNESFV